MTENKLPINSDLDVRIAAPLKRLQRGLIIIFSLTVIMGGYGIWWYVVASQFDKSISMWVERQHAQGVEVTFGERSQKGFPGPVHFVFKKPQIQKSGPRGWAWSGDVLNVSLKPWALNHMMFDVVGRHQWRFHKPTGVATLEGAAKKWNGVLILKEGSPVQVNINLSALEIKDTGVTDNFKVTEVEIEILEILKQAPSFKFRIRGMELPETLQSPLGRDVRYVDAKGNFTGRFQLGKWPDVLAAWRDGGGELDFKSFDLDYPPLRVRGDGTVALDSKMQPVGTFAVKADGVFETVDALYNQGLIPIRTSFATKIALGVLSKKSVDGEMSYLNMALTLQDRTLYAGTVKLLKIDPVRW